MVCQESSKYEKKKSPTLMPEMGQGDIKKTTLKEKTMTKKRHSIQETRTGQYNKVTFKEKTTQEKGPLWRSFIMNAIKCIE